MPLFHFNIFDGYSALDRDGTELPDWDAVQVLAVRHAGEVLQADAKRIVPGENWHMEVTDERGFILFRIDFSLMRASAPAGPAS